MTRASCALSKIFPPSNMCPYRVCPPWRRVTMRRVMQAVLSINGCRHSRFPRISKLIKSRFSLGSWAAIFLFKISIECLSLIPVSPINSIVGSSSAALALTSEVSRSLQFTFCLPLQDLSFQSESSS